MNFAGIEKKFSSTWNFLHYFLIILLTMLLFSNNYAQNLAKNKKSGNLIAGETLSYKNANLSVEERVKDLLSKMTLKEKARQLDMYSGAKDFLDDSQIEDNTHAKPDAVFNPSKAEKVLGNLGVGAIHDIYPRPALYNSLQAWVIKSNRLGIPALFIEEGLHGYIGLNKTIFPQSVNLATTWNTKLAKETGAAIASEARADGVDMILGPVLDIARDPRWGRVEEDFGEDPFLSGRMAAAYVEGMQGMSLASDSNCIAEPKHFAGYGLPESGLNTAPVHAGEREIREVLLKSFEPAVREAHTMGIMAAYNSIDGVPCTANSWLLNEILRHEWGFDGFVLSDLGAISRLYNIFHVAATPADAIYLALKSGVDMQFYDFPHELYQNAIVEGVKDGKISLAVVDSAVSRILRVKFMLGLFDHPYIDTSLTKKVCRSDEHLALALKVARQSMCLLKNEGELLPLKKGLDVIAVIGPNADSTRLGDYSGFPKDRQKEGMLAQIKKIVEPGTKVLYSYGGNIDSALIEARMAEVVILALGENSRISGEGHDRSKLGLPGNQKELMKAVVETGVPVVLVLQNGRPLAIPWAAKHVPAILEAWYPGEFGGRAIAETIFGENNPAGRLSISFPKSVGQLPVYYDHGPSKMTKYISGDDSPQFVFGYGLSYTSFKYDSLKIMAPSSESDSDIVVSFRLSDVGNRDGDEVAQVYVHKKTATVETPVKSLKGFKRVYLKHGESKKIKIHIKQADLAIWGIDKKWEIEPGEYKVMVGGSSKTTLSGNFILRD